MYPSGISRLLLVGPGISSFADLPEVKALLLANPHIALIDLEASITDLINSSDDYNMVLKDLTQECQKIEPLFREDFKPDNRPFYAKLPKYNRRKKI